MKISCNKYPINAINRQARHMTRFLIKKLPLISACLAIAVYTCGHKINAMAPGEAFNPEKVKILHQENLTLQHLMKPEFQEAIKYYKEQERQGEITEETSRKIADAQRAFAENIFKDPDTLLARGLQSRQADPTSELGADQASAFVAKYIAEALSDPELEIEPKKRIPVLIKVLKLFDAGRLERLLAKNPEDIGEVVGNLIKITAELSKTAETSQEKETAIAALSDAAKIISKVNAPTPAAKDRLRDLNLAITSALVAPSSPESGALGLAAEMGKKELSDLTKLVSTAVLDVDEKPEEIYKNLKSPDATRPPQRGGYMEQMEHLLVDIFNADEIDRAKIQKTLSSAINDTIKKFEKINSKEAQTAKRGLENFLARLDLFMRLKEFNEAPEKIKLITEISGETMRMALQDARDFAFDPLVRGLLEKGAFKNLSDEAFDSLEKEVDKNIRQNDLPKEVKKEEREQYLKHIKNEGARRNKITALSRLSKNNQALKTEKNQSLRQAFGKVQLVLLDDLSKLDPLKELDAQSRADLADSIETLYSNGISMANYADGRTISLQEIYQNLFKNGFDKLKKNVPLTWALVDGFMEGLEWFFGLFKSPREFGQDRNRALENTELLKAFLDNLTKRLEQISDIPKEALEKNTQKIAAYKKVLDEELEKLKEKTKIEGQKAGK